MLIISRYTVAVTAGWMCPGPALCGLCTVLCCTVLYWLLPLAGYPRARPRAGSVLEDEDGAGGGHHQQAQHHAADAWSNDITRVPQFYHKYFLESRHYALYYDFPFKCITRQRLFCFFTKRRLLKLTSQSIILERKTAVADFRKNLGQNQN